MNATRGPMMPLSFSVNGHAVSAEVEPRLHLADFLRETLNLTGTHLGCEHGVCGACTLLVDGEPVRSCITFAGACGGADVTTIEGLDNDEIAVELRAAFNREHALQCGFCTPGMLVSARDLVLRLREPDERRVRLGLSGNLCRCTGYVGIAQAVKSVIAARRERGIAAIVADPDRAVGPVGARIGSGLSTGRPPRKPSRRAFPRRLRRPLRHSSRPTGSSRLSQLAAPQRRCSLHSDASARSRIAFPARWSIASRPRIGSRAAFASNSGRSLRSSAGRPSSNATNTNWSDESWGWAPTPASARPCRARFAIALSPAWRQGPPASSLRSATPSKARWPSSAGRVLVRNLAGRMIGEFSRNFEGRLTGRPSKSAPKPINFPRLVLDSLAARLARWIKKLVALSE